MKERQLLLKDLSARLPYGVIVEIQGHYDDGEKFIRESEFDNTMLGYLYDDETTIKPYLRPMSSMTEKEWEDWCSEFSMPLGAGANATSFKVYNYVVADFGYSKDVYLDEIDDMISWLNAHHFDYRGLIEKGLAIEVNNKNNPY